ncbi:HAAS signaling domain-containing protein [Pseudonocardia acidicola]|uniref:DUF1700 domain-containing protein n=1 Tax=Pseudonocardia acidicola TaxID=2724939 RepID=A0ABX1S4L7_9PSEU|nr:hypothetical protein [Pseudonocardia acidicola]
MSANETETTGEPIDDYLDALLLRLHLPPRETRRLLTETEAHLRETAAGLQAHGMESRAAEREAVRRFGSAREIASAAGAARRPTLPTLLAQAVWACLALAGAGLLAVGLSGALAALLNAVAGPGFVGALPRSYPAATCHYYLAVHPGSGSCAQAAMWETSQDAVSLRALAGVLGLLLLAAAWLWRRALSGDPALAALRDGTVGAIAGLVFTAAAAFLIGTCVDLAVQHGSGGVGYYLTGAIVAIPAALLAGIWSYRRLRLLRPWRLVHATA